MEVKVYNQKGEEIGKTKLPKEIFEVPLNYDLIHQVAISMMANQRIPWAHTKDRGEVRGGGRKPWRQKGTGRARAGSNRSPIWIGGGVTHGPRKERKYEKKIPKKMKRGAMLSALSGKAKDEEIIILDKIEVSQPKTKEMAKILDSLRKKVKSMGKSSAIIAIPKKDDNIVRAGANIPKIKIIEAKNLNLLDLLNNKYLIMPKDSIEIIKKIFIKE